MSADKPKRKSPSGSSQTTDQLKARGVRRVVVYGKPALLADLAALCEAWGCGQGEAVARALAEARERLRR